MVSAPCLFYKVCVRHRNTQTTCLSELVNERRKTQARKNESKSSAWGRGSNLLPRPHALHVRAFLKQNQNPAKITLKRLACTVNHSPFPYFCAAHVHSSLLERQSHHAGVSAAVSPSRSPCAAVLVACSRLWWEGDPLSDASSESQWQPNPRSQ